LQAVYQVHADNHFWETSPPIWEELKKT